jgi:chromosome segregation ATPase
MTDTTHDDDDDVCTGCYGSGYDGNREETCHCVPVQTHAHDTTHDDLAKQLRDRIEELEAKLAQMQRTLDWTEERAKDYKDGREMMGHKWAKAEEGRRKAIEAMERAVFLWEQPHYGDDDTLIDHGSEAIDILRTTLADLKETPHD